MFKINVAKIKNENGKKIGLDLKQDLHQTSSDLNDVDINQPVSISGEIINVDGELIFTGQILISLNLICSRCLKKYAYTIKKDLVETFCPPYLSSERNENNDCRFFEGEYIDFAPIIEETIILNLPMKSICDVNCRGLCSQCGHDLNQGRCSCEQEVIDPRFEVLKKFKQ